MEQRSISDFQVSMDGKEYRSVFSWDIDKSKAEKAYQKGINYTADGLELCWGIEYGSHKYNVQYTIENLVWQYDDNQILYFSFLPKNMKQAPQNYKLTVTGGDFTGVKYSSYGFKSTNKIENGKVVFESKGRMKSDEYVAILIGFPKDMFRLDVTKTGSYDDVATEALKGARSNDFSYFSLIAVFLLISGSLLYLAFKIGLGRDRYDETAFVIPSEVNYFRDIPFDKDMLKAYFPGKEKNIIEQEGLMGAYLLKWIKTKRITMVPTEGDIIDFNKDDNYYIDLGNLGDFDNLTEKELAEYMLEVADEEKHITPQKFKRWCSKNYSKIESWLDDAEKRSIELLVAEDYIIKKEETYGKNKTRNIYVLTEKLSAETTKLKGLKKFLNEMSVIDDKKAIEVHLWDEYLIFAQLFGIADKVAKQFNDFYPKEYSQREDFYSNIFWISHFSTMATHAALSASHLASSGGSYSGGSYSGGGYSSGGFSSGGGGVR